MPTYEYLCQNCSHRFEMWQKMTDEPAKSCPECSSPVRRVLYPAGVVFKGSGFYKTDYSKNGAVSSDKNGNSKEAESTNGQTTPTTGEGKAGESKISSEASNSTGSATNNSTNTSSSESSKSTVPATT